MHTDTYGRAWRYQPHPSHDMAKALQISRGVAEFGINTDLRFSGLYSKVTLADNTEPYLVKLPLAGWQLFVRVGDGVGDFYDNSDIDERVISMMLDLHAKEITDRREAKAYDALAEQQ